MSQFTSKGCLEVYHGVKVYWWRVSRGISWCQGLLVEVILRYIVVCKVYYWRFS
jgi:hypothetical protein